MQASLDVPGAELDSRRNDADDLLELDGGGIAPRAPKTLDETGVDPSLVRQLALKLAYSTYSFTTDSAAESLRLPEIIVADVLEQLLKQKLLEVLGQAGPFSHRYAISGRGAEEARRCLEICGHIGAAPVSLEAYRRLLERQLARLPESRAADVEGAVAPMVLPDGAVRVAGLAVASGRSLFLYGPPGNGKTTLGRLIHGALRGDLWIPECLAVGESVLRVFDPLCHRPLSAVRSPDIDGRWVRILRPLVAVGGELTVDSLDAAYSETTRTYEAPIHVKSNGGLLLIDDFGRQRVEPHELLNRWIVPLEYGVDHLTLRTGQQIQVPFRQTLIFATNLDLGRVTDSAFLRRIGYRLELRNPPEEEYAEIFRRHAAGRGVDAPPGTVGRLLERYRQEGRELRACHPRDLIDRALDLRRFEGKEPGLDEVSLELAWVGYFGAA